MVKIPDRIRIGGVNYAVTIVPNLRKDNVSAYGHISYDDCVIELSDTDGTAHEKRCIVLLHEILHGIVEHYSDGIENEEQTVNMFSKGLYQVLQDNGSALFDVTQEGAERER